MPRTYLYRSTEDKVDRSLELIAEAGDTVEHIIFKGGRDYVLVVTKATEPPTVVLTIPDGFVDELALAMVRAQAAAAREHARTQGPAL